MNDIPMICKQEWQHPGIDGSRHLFIAVNELWLSLADGFLLISHLQKSGVQSIHCEDSSTWCEQKAQQGHFSISTTKAER